MFITVFRKERGKLFIWLEAFGDVTLLFYSRKYHRMSFRPNPPTQNGSVSRPAKGLFTPTPLVQVQKTLKLTLPNTLKVHDIQGPNFLWSRVTESKALAFKTIIWTENLHSLTKF